MSVDLNEIEQAEDELEDWLVDQAESGVPEVVLIGTFVTTLTTSSISAMSRGCGATATDDVTPTRLAGVGFRARNGRRRVVIVPSPERN